MNNIDTTSDLRPPLPAHWGFWGTALWGIAISVCFVVLQVITILALVASSDRNVSGPELTDLIKSAGENGYVLSLSTFVTTMVCCGLILGVIKLKRNSTLREYLGLRAIPLRTMLKWTALLLCVVVLSDFVTVLRGRPIVPDFMSAIYATASPLWTLWVALVIAAPLFEETFFRGFLLRGLESSFMGPVGAVIVTAGMWAAIHVQYDAFTMATIFSLGLLFGAARVVTGSLLVPIGLHAITNLVATIEAAIFA